MLKSVDQYLDRKDTRGLVLLLMLPTLLLGIVDYFSGQELSFSYIYTLPIMLAVWYGGYAPGVIVTLVSITVWLLIELTTGRDYSHPLVLVWNTAILLVFFLIIVRLLPSMKDKVSTLANLATIDSLTGLFNRRYFLEQMERERTRIRRYPEVFTVAYIDLDNFKYVNDTRGHVVGDDLLQSVGKTIQQNLRESDICARLGGDEFVVFFPALAEKPALHVMQELQQELLQAMQRNAWSVTFSIGMVTYLKPMKSIREMMYKADELMYRVKKSGKNNILQIVVPDTVTGAGSAKDTGERPAVDGASGTGAAEKS